MARALGTNNIDNAAHAGALDVLYLVGGNFLETMPDPDYYRDALKRVRLRIHQDLVLNTSTLVDGDEVLVLPAATRYEQRGGGTSTSTERRVRFSPEIPGRRIAEARAEWEILAAIGIRTLDGASLASDEFLVTTRRGKQFNSMTHHDRDALTGTTGRDAVFMAAEDAARLGLDEGSPLRLVSTLGAFAGRCRIAAVKPGSLQIYWPEGNILIGRRLDPASGEPDYNAVRVSAGPARNAAPS